MRLPIHWFNDNDAHPFGNILIVEYLTFHYLI